MVHRIALLASAILLNAAVLVDASPRVDPAMVRFDVVVEGGGLSIKNLRIDRRDGAIRGTVYVNFGYPTPRTANVHAYGLSPSGEVVAEGCDKLNGVFLSRHPHRTGWRHGGFAIALRGQTGEVRVIRLVVHAGKSGC